MFSEWLIDLCASCECRNLFQRAGTTSRSIAVLKNYHAILLRMRQTLILIHGFRGTHHGLERVADELRTDYDVIVPDLPGFGEGDSLPEYTLQAYVDWLDEFISNLSLASTPHLLGHSFGSIITAAYAAQHGDRIATLSLINPIGAPALEGPRGILTKLAITYYWLGRVLPERLGSAWLSAKPIVFLMSTTMAKTPDPTLRKWIHAQHYRYFSTYHSASSISDAFRTSVSHSVRDFATQITTPTLLVAGEKDDITPLAAQHVLLRKFPDASLVVIDNVGHLTHYETPDQVASAVREFIAASDTTTQTAQASR